MTVSSAVAKSGPYTGADDFVFAYNFRVFADAELQVTTVVVATGVEEILTLTTDYTVQDAGDPTGTVTLTAGTFPTGLPSTKKLVVSRDMGFLQEIDFENQGGFFPDTHEDGFDRLKMEVLQVKEEVDRSVKVDITGTITADDLLDDIADSVAAASASAAAAAASETAASTSETNAGLAQGYAEEWATKAEDSLVSVAAGGNGVDEYSALHWAAKAAAEDAYSKAELDGGQLDTRYYTETEVDANTYSRTQLDAGQLDTRYYTETEVDANTYTQAQADANFAPKKVNGGTTATTSGTAHDFTGIPSWATKISLVIDEVSLSGTDYVLVQIGDAGGFETTGYVAESGAVVDSANPVVQSDTTGFPLLVNVAAREFTGTLELINPTGNIWVCAHAGRTAAAIVNVGAGRKELSAVLTQLRLTISGSDTFDNGAVTLFYE